jgi:hypothetical protein
MVLKVAWRHQIVRTLLNAEMFLHGRLIVDALHHTEALSAEGILRRGVRSATPPRTGGLNINVTSGGVHIMFFTA